MYLDGLSSVVTIPGVSSANCQAQGGYYTPTGWNQGTCTVVTPDVASSAPANVTVNTSTNTQVSPIISPNLVQQQQPTNSPVGLTSSGAPTQTPQQTNNQDTALVDYLKQMEANQAAQQAARDKAMQDALKTAQSAAPAVSYETQYVPDTTQAAPPGNTAPAAQPESFFVKNAPYELIGAAALLGVILIGMKKGKR